MRLVEHNVACLVSRQEPPTVVLSRKIGGSIRKEAGSHHVAIKRILAFLFTETRRGRFLCEIILKLLAEPATCKNEPSVASAILQNAMRTYRVRGR